MANLVDGDLIEKSRSQQSTAPVKSFRPVVWYCPSRWLIAHHDPQANIYTLPSHMCLADLNNDGESLLALIDFKPRPQRPSGVPAELRLPSSRSQLAPYDCRLRVYRGQQLIYNHFLDDMPACLLAASVREPPSRPPVPNHSGLLGNNLQRRSGSPQQSASSVQGAVSNRCLLALAINDDVYFYHKLKPSHRIVLEDAECILDTLDKSEVDAWHMVRQNKVDTETLHQLLSGLSDELGGQELTSHTNNFLALDSNEERRKYLTSWKLKRYPSAGNSKGYSDGEEHLMSMDTICCAAARLSYSSNVTRSGDFGETRETKTFVNNARWTKILDIQRDGLVLGTEDRHLLIYELRTSRCRLESHCRLPSQPDHILVERRSPSSFDLEQELKSLAYMILVSCRNCRIYCLRHNYVVDSKKLACDSTNELVALRCNVVEMCWIEEEPTIVEGKSYPNFIVASLDKKVYCFGSQFGACKWLVEVESPITCIVGLPRLQVDPNESSLVGIASQANRIDFHVSSSGRIMDSIYFANDSCQSMVFGRFGREDNCLCVTTTLGQLMIFILKRTAKFTHGQCLSSAASYAADTLASYNLLNAFNQSRQHSSESKSPPSAHLTLTKPADLPSAFALTTKSTSSSKDQAIESLQLDHDCDQVNAKGFLDSQLATEQLQVPAKNRDFVDRIVDQSRHSEVISRKFAKHMIELRDKIKSTIEQQLDLQTLDSTSSDSNRVTLTSIIGLGNTYRISLSLRLNLKSFIAKHLEVDNELRESSDGEKLLRHTDPILSVSVFLFVNTSNRQAAAHNLKCQVKPFKFQLDFMPTKLNEPQRLIDTAINDTNMLQQQQQCIFERTIEFKLVTWTSAIDGTNDNERDQIIAAAGSDLVTLDIYALVSSKAYGNKSYIVHSDKVTDHNNGLVLVSSLNIPTC